MTYLLTSGPTTDGGYMAWYDFLTGGSALTKAITSPALASPFAPSHNLADAIVTDFFGAPDDDGTAYVTPELALRVPEVNRALQAHTALVAPLKLAVYRDGHRAEVQPAWTTNSDTGISPYIRAVRTVSDLFLFGWALWGARLDAFGLPDDFLHIPRNLWDVDSETGVVKFDPSIPTAYRNAVLIPLGSNGLLVDGIDSIRQARKLELARQKRIDAPPAAVELHITDTKFDEMSREEKQALADSYTAGRRKSGVSVTPSYLEVKTPPSGGDVDLFESGMNSLRLQLGMHGGVPASFLEAGKEGGSNGNMTYSNQDGKASELWLFGSSRFAYAITARLSLDDVVGPNAEVRADLAEHAVPAPAELSPETPVDAPQKPAPAPITE